MSTWPENKEDTAMARRTPKKAHAGFEGIDIGYLGSKEESAEERTVESRKRLREILDNQVREFIQRGGEIKQLDTQLVKEPPKNIPTSYGSGPI